MYKDESRFRTSSVVRNLKNDVILEKTYATKKDCWKHMTARYIYIYATQVYLDVDLL